MLLSKGSKRLPVLDLPLSRRHHPGGWLKATGRRFALQPQVDGVTSDLKQRTGLTLLQPIKFYGADDLLTQIKAVGFGHFTPHNETPSLRLRPNHLGYSYM